MKPYTDEGEPIACPHCYCQDFRGEAMEWDGGVVSEELIRCNYCDRQVGYWAYGRWYPIFVQHDDPH